MLFEGAIGAMRPGAGNGGKIDATLSGEFHEQSAAGLRGNAVGAFVSVPLPLFSRNQGEIARARGPCERAIGRLNRRCGDYPTQQGEHPRAWTELLLSAHVIPPRDANTLQWRTDEAAPHRPEDSGKTPPSPEPVPPAQAVTDPPSPVLGWWHGRLPPSFFQ